MARETFTRSLWHASAGPADAHEPLEGRHQADVAIVGAGYTGLAAALAVAERGKRAIVLEAHEPGFGASGRNGGFVVPSFAKGDPDQVLARLGRERGERLLDLVAHSAEGVFDLIARHGIDCEAEQNGWIQPAHAPIALPRVQSRYAQWAARGRPVDLLGREEVVALTGCASFVGGWMDRSGGMLHPLKYARGLARAAVAAGAAVHGASPVRRILAHDGAWRVETAAGSIDAAAVLVCTNAYVGRLQETLRRSFIPLTVFQAATAPIDAALCRRIAPGRQSISDTREFLFTYRYDGGRRLISGAMAVIETGALGRMARLIAARLARLLDLPAVPRIDHVWSGRAAITPDFLPRLYEPMPGLIAGIGCNGRGIAMTTALGGVMADAALGAPREGLAIAPSPLKALPLHVLAPCAVKVALPLGRWRDRRALAAVRKA